MAFKPFVDFQADVPALTQGEPAVALLPLLKQLQGWEEVHSRPCLAVTNSGHSPMPGSVTLHALLQVLDEDDIATSQINGAMTNLIFRVENLLTSEVGYRRIFTARSLPGHIQPHRASTSLLVACSLFWFGSLARSTRSLAARTSSAFSRQWRRRGLDHGCWRVAFCC